MKKPPFQPNLKKRFQAFAFISVGSVVLFSVLGFWRIQYFNEKLFALRENSHQLENNLRENFESTKLVGDIRTSLRLYMQLAEPAFLSRIHNDTEILARTLPDALKKDLNHFLEMVNVLEVRMNSLRENSTRVYEIEKRIMAANRELLMAVDRSFFFKIQNITSTSCLKHHHLYVSSLLTGQPDTLKHLQEETAASFMDLHDRLSRLAEELPDQHRAKAVLLIEAYLDLEDAVNTIAAIRSTTLTTQIEVEKELNLISVNIAQNSLGRLNTVSQFVWEGLALAKRNFTLLVYSFICFSILFCLMVFYLNRRMVAPLITFVDLLRKTADIMVGIRNQRVEQNENYQALALLGSERRDEIGDMAEAVKSLVLRMKDLFVFRQAIEADQTTEQIYNRLATIFSEKYSLAQFIIYEITPQSEGMEVVHAQPAALQESLPHFRTADICRASRTGIITSSIEDPQACSIFPFKDRFDHICLPMLVGGSVIGVIEFLLPLALSPEERTAARNKIEEAYHFVAEALPVLQSKHLAARLQQMAIRDQLTGLYNRHFLQETLPQLSGSALRRNSTLGILMCDLDKFKEINDNFGHGVGDMILAQLAKILVNTTRGTDLVIRFGGEEFVVILVDCGFESALAMAEKLRKNVEQYKFHTGEMTLKLTVSIGVSVFPDGSEEDIESAINEADRAMYRAKEQGRNRVLSTITSGPEEPPQA